MSYTWFSQCAFRLDLKSDLCFNLKMKNEIQKVQTVQDQSMILNKAPGNSTNQAPLVRLKSDFLVIFYIFSLFFLVGRGQEGDAGG
jgi:hypothetical protein